MWLKNNQLHDLANVLIGGITNMDMGESVQKRSYYVRKKDLRVHVEGYTKNLKELRKKIIRRIWIFYVILEATRNHARLCWKAF